MKNLLVTSTIKVNIWQPLKRIWMLISLFYFTLSIDSSDGLHLSQVNPEPLRVPIHCTPATNSFVVGIIFKIKTSFASQRPPAATWAKNNVMRKSGRSLTSWRTFAVQVLAAYSVSRERGCTRAVSGSKVKLLVRGSDSYESKKQPNGESLFLNLKLTQKTCADH